MVLTSCRIRAAWLVPVCCMRAGCQVLSSGTNRVLHFRLKRHLHFVHNGVIFSFQLLLPLKQQTVTFLSLFHSFCEIRRTCIALERLHMPVWRLRTQCATHTKRCACVCLNTIIAFRRTLETKCKEGDLPEMRGLTLEVEIRGLILDCL